MQTVRSTASLVASPAQRSTSLAVALVGALVVAAVLATPATGSTAETADLPAYLGDRGTGVSSSMFGTYIGKHEFVFYPFYEYYRDDDQEYQPDEFGLASTDEFRGKFRGHEALVFLGYGLTDWLIAEFEAAVYFTGELTISPDDKSGLPAVVEDSGLGDVEGQFRWRYNRESDSTPEIFSYLEYVLPTGDENTFVGTADLELKLGIGLVKGFAFGTMTVRAAAEYDRGESRVSSGEYAVEYLKRLSPSLRAFLAVEGTEDEASLITQLEWRLHDHAAVRLNSGFGLTSKAADWTPELGVVFSF